MNKTEQVKRGPGQPPKGENDLKKLRQIRVETPLWNQVKKRSQEQGHKSVSEYIRNLIAQDCTQEPL